MLLDQEFSSEESKLLDKQILDQSIERLHNLAVLLQGILLLLVLVNLSILLKDVVEVIMMLLLFIPVEVIFIYISSMILGFLINFIPYKGIDFITRFPRSVWIGIIIIHFVVISTLIIEYLIPINNSLT